MSGGAWDYVMGVRGNITAGSSGFKPSNVPDVKYYDVYNANSTETTFQYRILGDGTGEFGPFKSIKDPDGSNRYKGSFYYNHAYFIDSTYPWFTRGAIWFHGLVASPFAFSDYTGNTNNTISFRIVLAI